MACTLGEFRVPLGVLGLRPDRCLCVSQFALVSHFSTPPVVVVSTPTSWLEPIQKHENRSSIQYHPVVLEFECVLLFRPSAACYLCSLTGRVSAALVLNLTITSVSLGSSHHL